MASTFQKTSNPAFNAGLMRSLSRQPRYDSDVRDTVSIEGAALKSLILLGLLMASSGAVLGYFLPTVYATQAIPAELIVCLVAGCIGGFVLAIYTIFVPSHSPYTAPAYAVVEGLAIGGISTVFEVLFPGIVLQAMGVTFGALLGILVLYGSGIIRVNDTFRAVIFGAMVGILFVYLAAVIFRLCGVTVPFLHELGGNGWIGIAFSGFVCVIAALNFAIDFQQIVDAKAAGAPRWFEWYLGFALLLTIVWLYLEVLRLLSKIRSSD